MSANDYRIYVVEDSPILLRLLRDMLGGIPGVHLIGHADRADKAITEIVETKLAARDAVLERPDDSFVMAALRGRKVLPKLLEQRSRVLLQGSGQHILHASSTLPYSHADPFCL